MTAKEYLNQACRLDERINSKLEQVEALRSLTRKATVSYGGEKVSCSRNVTTLENTIIRLMEAEEDLNRQIDELVDLKRDIAQSIGALDNTEYQLLLEKRYLSFHSWEKIAEDMHYSPRWVHIVHSRALKAFEKKSETVHKSAHEFT